MSPAFEKNALTGDGCCWYAQHGLCHRTKNRITGLMLCQLTYGTRWAVYRWLCHVLINFSCTESLGHIGQSCSASGIELCPNRRLWQFCRTTWCSGGWVVAFHRRSRPLMFAHDTYSGTNGRLTPFVCVDSNAMSLNLGSTTVATQVRSRDFTAFAN